MSWIRDFQPQGDTKHSTGGTTFFTGGQLLLQGARSTGYPLDTALIIYLTVPMISAMGENPGSRGTVSPLFSSGGTVPGDGPLTSKLRPPCPPPHLFRFVSLKCSDSSVFQSINILCPPIFCTSPPEGETRKKVGGHSNFFSRCARQTCCPPHFPNVICALV